MGFQSMMINLSHRSALVVGGGKVATRRVETLEKAEAVITVVSPWITPALEEKVQRGSITWQERKFALQDVKIAWIVVAATDDPAVNRLIAEVAGKSKLVNVCDTPHLGNFHIPVTLKRGHLTISVSTGGASPLLAQRIRNQFAMQFGEEWERKMEILLRERKKIQSWGGSATEKRAALQRLVDKVWEEKH